MIRIFTTLFLLAYSTIALSQEAYYISTNPTEGARKICFVNSQEEASETIHFCKDIKDAVIKVFLSKETKNTTIVLKRKAKKKTKTIQFTEDSKEVLHRIHLAPAQTASSKQIFIVDNNKDADVSISMDPDEIFKGLSDLEKQLMKQQYIAALIYERTFKVDIYKREVSVMLIESWDRSEATSKTIKEAQAYMEKCNTLYKEDDIKTNFSLTCTSLEKIRNTIMLTSEQLEQARKMSRELKCKYASIDISDAIALLEETDEIAMTIADELNNSMLSDNMNTTKHYISTALIGINRLVSKIKSAQSELSKSIDLFRKCTEQLSE